MKTLAAFQKFRIQEREKQLFIICKKWPDISGNQGLIKAV
jgi:hypothetical protein